MTFVMTLSPKGGKRLTSLFSHLSHDKNLIFHPEKRPEEVGDYFAWKIGYSDKELKKGDPLFIRKSDAKWLKKLLDMYV